MGSTSANSLPKGCNHIDCDNSKEEAVKIEPLSVLTLSQADWTLLVEYLKVKRRKIVKSIKQFITIQVDPTLLKLVDKPGCRGQTKNTQTEHQLQTTVEIMLKTLVMVSKLKVW